MFPGRIVPHPTWKIFPYPCLGKVLRPRPSTRPRLKVATGKGRYEASSCHSPTKIRPKSGIHHASLLHRGTTTFLAAGSSTPPVSRWLQTWGRVTPEAPLVTKYPKTPPGQPHTPRVLCQMTPVVFWTRRSFPSCGERRGVFDMQTDHVRTSGWTGEEDRGSFLLGCYFATCQAEN